MNFVLIVAEGRREEGLERLHNMQPLQVLYRSNNNCGQSDLHRTYTYATETVKHSKTQQYITHLTLAMHTAESLRTPV